MKFDPILALTLVLSLYGVSFGQGHRTDDSQVQSEAQTPQGTEAPSRPLSNLVRDSDNGMRLIKQTVRNRGAGSFDGAVDSYISILSQIRAALRQPGSNSKNFDKDLARVEKMSKTNLVAFKDLRKTAPADISEKLEDASAATAEIYSAASNFRKEIYSEGGQHRGNHGCCGHGSHGGGGSEGLGGGGHHRGWFSPGRLWGWFSRSHHS